MEGILRKLRLFFAILTIVGLVVAYIVLPKTKIFDYCFMIAVVSLVLFVIVLILRRFKQNNRFNDMFMDSSSYVRPLLSFLTTTSAKRNGNKKVLKHQALVLERTLESFKIPAKVVAIVRGPAVTRFEVQIAAGVSVKKVTQHVDDLSMMLQSSSGVRVEAPIPGKNLVGVEVPNEKVATVGLRDILVSPEYQCARAPLTVALGKDIVGGIHVCDIASMPHLLVAGATGSGKSVCLNIILVSLLYRLGPEDLKLILIDPKRVEFSSFNGIPHLLTKEAIWQPEQALNAFDWAIAEMESRLDTFQRLHVKELKEYNALGSVQSGTNPKLPRIVIVVDELADLMMMGKKDLEGKIARIAQLARAVGIHLILATQRPSVNVITGIIKANLPSRIAFAVNSATDSTTIINQGGAEKLLGKGDSLYFPQNLPEPVRIQCPFITNAEVLRIVRFIKERNPRDEKDDIVAKAILSGGQNDTAGDSAPAPTSNVISINKELLPSQNENVVDSGNLNIESEGSVNAAPSSSVVNFDPLLPEALLDFIHTGTASITALQRKYGLGYIKAARIVDQMEQAGFISAPDASHKRRVLIDEDKYNEIFS